jgi:predicted nuclease of predicted toxin-antitoxin system
MKLLLDQGSPRTAVEGLRLAGHEAVHTAELGLSTASDSQIIEHARCGQWIVVTLDADFHAQIAVENAASPSIIRVRQEGLRAEALVHFLLNVIRACEGDLEKGALVSATREQVRVRTLPVGK